jgi:lysozyme
MKVSTNLAITASVLALGVVSVQANNLFGIDVSNYQGSINWATVKANGPTYYAFAKATEGTYYQDGYYNANMNNGKAAGVQMGAYHFARPDTTCPSSQVNYHWNFAGGKIIADGKSLMPMVDFETYNGAYCEASYTAWFNDWSIDIKAKTTHFLHPVLYSSAGSGMCYVSSACTLSAWVANYNGQNLYTGGPWSCCTSCNYVAPGTGNGWTYWQVSSTGQIGGISGNVDFDAFPSTLANLVSWQGIH